jgi:hypothetical protein
MAARDLYAVVRDSQMLQALQDPARLRAREGVRMSGARS